MAPPGDQQPCDRPETPLRKARGQAPQRRGQRPPSSHMPGPGAGRPPCAWVASSQNTPAQVTSGSRTQRFWPHNPPPRQVGKQRHRHSSAQAVRQVPQTGPHSQHRSRGGNPPETGAGGFCPAHPGSRTSYSRCVCGERAGPELCAGTLVHGGSTSGTSSNLTTQGILPLGAGCPPEDSRGTQTFCGHTWERGPQGQTPTSAALRPLPPPPWEQAVGLGGLLTPKKSTVVLTWSCSALYKYTLIWILFMSCGEGVWSRLPRGGAASRRGWALGEEPGSGTRGRARS